MVRPSLPYIGIGRWATQDAEEVFDHDVVVVNSRGQVQNCFSDTAKNLHRKKTIQDAIRRREAVELAKKEMAKGNYIS